MDNFSLMRSLRIRIVYFIEICRSLRCQLYFYAQYKTILYIAAQSCLPPGYRHDEMLPCRSLLGGVLFQPQMAMIMLVEYGDLSGLHSAGRYIAGHISSAFLKRCITRTVACQKPTRARTMSQHVFAYSIKTLAAQLRFSECKINIADYKYYFMIKIYMSKVATSILGQR